MAVGREFLPPEEADSWGEYRARLEFEAANPPGSPLTPLWWIIAPILFAVALFSCAYAVQYHHLWWLWLCMLAALGALGVMAMRAVEQADRRRARAAELRRLEDAWQQHLNRHSRTW